MTSRKNKTLFTDEFLNVFNSINLQSLFVYDNGINVCVDFNSHKLNTFLSTINSYGKSLSDSILNERLILNVPIKESILGLYAYGNYKSNGLFSTVFLSHIYNASINPEAFKHQDKEDIYLDVSFIDLYSMSIAYFLIELYKNTPGVTKFKSICKSISTAIKNNTFIINFTPQTTDFQLVNCKFTDIFDYYGKEVSDFEDSSFIAKVSSQSFAPLTTDYKIYCSLSRVPYHEHYSYLTQEEAVVHDHIFATSSPFLIPYSIPEYFNKLATNSTLANQESINDSVSNLVTTTINSLFSLDVTDEPSSSNRVSPITFEPITHICNIHSKAFNLDLFGSKIDFFMNFNTGSKSICASDYDTVSFSRSHLRSSLGAFTDSILGKAKQMNLYKDPDEKANTLTLNKIYLIDPSYNYSVYFLGKAPVRALPFSPYIFFRNSLYSNSSNVDRSPVSIFTSTEGTGGSKHYYVRSFDFKILSSYYLYASSLNDTSIELHDVNFPVQCQSFSDSKLNSIVDYAFKHNDSMEVSLLTYFYYLLKDSDNHQSIYLIMDLFS